ncbi:acriflavine resistance protein B [Idiomarina piscisalsi]|uniref:Acriflavine resistance protein B n=1 Tax=Idiomarina piscisalsi TaxID=1096243 RepID=A0ABM6LW56_9GAMM|nr:efflux RND transporter permease subunit [Idiomarina piscisalsi]ASG66840.1 acriflavine resistance protein B [Idiomarina piscisalsi]
MSLIKSSHKNPFATVVAFLIVIILGTTALINLPVQLMPNIDKPVITVLNSWRSAAPEEMESEIVEPQEEIIKNIVGVESIKTSVRNGMSFTTIEFNLEQDMQQAFINVINALNQVQGMPIEAAEPMTILGEYQAGTATMMIRKLGENQTKDFTEYQELIKHKVAPRLRNIPGVTNVNLASYLNNQLQVTFDPYKLAALGITIPKLMSRVTESKDFSGGFADVGRREYSVRYQGQFSPEELEQLVVSHNEGRPVYLGEVADVVLGYQKQYNFIYRNSQPGFYISLDASKKANTIEIFEHLNKVIAELNEHELNPRGLDMVLSFDSSSVIKRAINLVQSNLSIGIALALLMLYWMIRGVRSTLLISITIPVSLSAALLGLSFLDRSLNIISLAGLAFSTGLVLDAAIVVQENIVRLRQQGLGLKEAVVKGAQEVSRALFAATVTTVAIFLPVIFMGGVAGQLFHDLAVTMSIAVVASTLTALLLLPVVAAFILKGTSEQVKPLPAWGSLAAFYQRYCRTPKQIMSWAVGLGFSSILCIFFLMPKTDFLPEAKFEGIIAVLQTPPSTNYCVLEEELAREIIERLELYRAGEKLPKIKDFNVTMSSGGKAVFIYPEDPSKSAELLQAVRTDVLSGLPDTKGFAFNMSLINSVKVGSGRSVYMDFTGQLDDTTDIVMQRTMKLIGDRIPGSYIRRVPNAQAVQAELQITPNNYAIANSGLNRNQVGQVIRSMTDGQFVGEHYDGLVRRDVIVKTHAWNTPEELAAMPVYTPGSGIQTIDQLTQQRRTVSATELRRLDGQRALTIGVTPPDNVSLEDTIAVLQELKLEAEQQLSNQTFISLSGGADDLKETVDTMVTNFAFAILILLLIMAAIFRSVVDSLLVLLTTPVAVAGGTLGLWILNLFKFQPLDLLTMIGFVILLGLVVNNAILMIEKTRHAQQRGLTISEAIAEAISQRVRPIYMSSLTSVVGMLPLALIPGAGSELYQGLAVVILSGMAISTLFTVFAISSLLYIAERLSPKRFVLEPSVSSRIPTSTL